MNLKNDTVDSCDVKSSKMTLFYTLLLTMVSVG